MRPLPPLPICRKLTPVPMREMPLSPTTPRGFDRYSALIKDTSRGHCALLQIAVMPPLGSFRGVGTLFVFIEVFRASQLKMAESSVRYCSGVPFSSCLSRGPHCGNSRALPAVRISTIVCELGFLLLMDQYAFSLKNKYMRISTTDTYRRYWRDLIVNG